MISQTIDYALRAMSSLASLPGTAATSETIATATHIPQAYLSKILRDLVRADLVKSFRGPHGGFVLARDAGDITLLDIVNAVDPIRRSATCPPDDLGHTDLSPLDRCMDSVLTHVEERLRSTSLGSVLASPLRASEGVP
jgi:Rrf2 family protein